MSHEMRCVRQPNGTWNYSCSCKKVKKDGLKFEASAKPVHDTHVRSVRAAKLAKG